MSEQLTILNPAGVAMSGTLKPVRVLGLDLGTTNSTVAEIVWQPDKPHDIQVRCLEIDQETTSGVYTHLLVPSAVAIHLGREWVGEGAKRLHARATELGLELTRNLFLECKNDIGSRRTYHKAPAGYRSPGEIAGKVVKFLVDGAAGQDAPPIKRTVVTVPASFQASQRLDTIRAAALAGITLCGGDLLDEPVAAFLDYLLSHPDELKGALATSKNLVIVDFGGGTCDVAIFQIGSGSRGQSLRISPLAVSRYHRLGGGDIDRAILYEALIPQLLKQNGLESFALTFEDKKNYIEPALLGVAEALKMGLCTEISRLQAFNRYDSTDKALIIKKQPGLHPCRVGDRQLSLQAPSLSASQFEEILAPFLDRDLLYARETEYRLTCSMFAPIQDALERSNLVAAGIDMCLLVGGSTLIPQVPAAIESFFPKATLLKFSTQEAVQVAVARGAAYHALALALFGRGIFQLASNDRISIRTASGFYELIPKGTLLPFPADGSWAHTHDLFVPDSSILKPVPLLVEMTAGETGQERPLLTARWEIPGPVNRGDALHLEYRMDENQVLEFRLTLARQTDAVPFEGRLENPLSNVVNPHNTRLKIQEAEEELRTGQVPQAEIPEKVVGIARDYAELQQTEKAISYLKQALRMKNRPDPNILNLLGIYYGEQGDFERQEKFYRECFAAAGGAAPLFNLALSQYQRKRFLSAKKAIEECLALGTHAPGLALAAQIAEGLKDEPSRDAYVEQALAAFARVQMLSDWELGWLEAACRVAEKPEKLDEVHAEQRRRKTKMQGKDAALSGLLPETTAALTLL